MDMTPFMTAFQPHIFRPGEDVVDLYHVYDNLSQTPYVRDRGIWCCDRDQYFVNAWHVITPGALLRHADWRNRQSTQFISFFANRTVAEHEAHRRRLNTYIPGGRRRDPNSVRVAHVRLPRGTNVWFFSRSEMLRMMQTLGGTAAMNMLQVSHPNEWYVWGDVPDENVENRNNL